MHLTWEVLERWIMLLQVVLHLAVAVCKAVRLMLLC